MSRGNAKLLDCRERSHSCDVVTAQQLKEAIGNVMVVVCAERDRERRGVADDGPVLDARRVGKVGRDLLETIPDVLRHLVHAPKERPKRAGLVFPGNIAVTEEG